MKEPIKIAIAEDHELLRKGLVSILGSEPQFEVVFEAQNGMQIMESLERIQPSVLVLDLDMPYMSGIEVLNELEKNYPHVKAIMLSMHHSRNFVLQCLILGARGFLAKNTNVDKIIESIESVHNYGFYVNDDKSMAFLESEVKKRQIPIPVTGVSMDWFEDLFQGTSVTTLVEKYKVNPQVITSFWDAFQNSLVHQRLV
ncbi:MAG: response regulator transcription factor [Fluviicola sp.]